MPSKSFNCLSLQKKLTSRSQSSMVVFPFTIDVAATVELKHFSYADHEHMARLEVKRAPLIYPRGQQFENEMEMNEIWWKMFYIFLFCILSMDEQ